MSEGGGHISDAAEGEGGEKGMEYEQSRTAPWLGLETNKGKENRREDVTERKNGGYHAK